jgi:ankyrin repeat protein
MKIKLCFKFHLPLVALAVLLATSGCWSAHPPSAYQTIHQCAINGDTAGVAAELAKSPKELNLPEDDGLTPLHLAAANCHTNVVLLLLDKGANINVAAKDNATPLHLAAQEGCADVVTVLLERSADVNPRDNQNRTPLKRAEQWHQNGTAQILKQHGGTE